MRAAVNGGESILVFQFQGSVAQVAELEVERCDCRHRTVMITMNGISK